MIPPNSREQDKEDKRSYWQRLVEFLHPGPDSREELLDALSDAEDNQVIGAESRLMLEGVLRMADLTAGHVMVAAPRMDLINLDAPLEDSLHQVIDTGHSRFPVYEGERDNLVGILLAKDLLKLQRAPELNIRTLLRPPVFVPESKSLNDLLREFRNTRNHMALVVDEFGRIAGLITIEEAQEETPDSHIAAELFTHMYASDAKDLVNVSVVSAGKAAESAYMGCLNFSWFDPKRGAARDLRSFVYVSGGVGVGASGRGRGLGSGADPPRGRSSSQPTASSWPRSRKSIR